MARQARVPVLVVACLSVCLAATPVQETLEAPESVWRVATKESPPFSYRDRDDRWQGIAIDLADEIAEELEVRLELVEAATVAEMLEMVETGRVDAAAAALSVTPEREQRVDFSHPYFASGLGVAVRSDGGGGSWFRALLRGVASRAFLELLGIVLLVLAGSALLFWVAEHRRHPQFQEGGTRGLGVGFWWSTIILFGHKGIFPKTLLGSVLAATGMLLSVLLLSVLTGAIASILTLSRLETSIRGVEDLRQLRTASVPGTSSQVFLDDRRVSFQGVSTPLEGLQGLQRNEVDAVVYDAPLLRHLTRQSFPDLTVVERIFDPQDYAIAFPLESPWRKPVNRALLAIRGGESWRDTLFRHLGSTSFSP